MNPFRKHSGSQDRTSASGFTLVEVMVAAAITIILVGILLSVTSVTGNAVKQSQAKLTSFSSARTAFDVMTQKLSQATLNTYLDYFDANGNHRDVAHAASFNPASYGRSSDLQFYIRQNMQNESGDISGNHGQEVYFQAPAAYSDLSTYQSIQGLLNVCGYYIAYGDSAQFQPNAVTTHRYRYRLMQGLEPTESLSVFANAISGNNGVPAWIANVTNGANGPPTNSVNVTPLADNIIALIIWPKLSQEDDATGLTLSGNYTYNSQYPVAPSQQGGLWTQPITANQLPPNVRITMIAIDEPSMIRLNQLDGNPVDGAVAPPRTIEKALQNKFTDASQYTTDLSSVITSLSAAHVAFQVFDATVVMRESKWSQNPTQ